MCGVVVPRTSSSMFIVQWQSINYKLMFVNNITDANDCVCRNGGRCYDNINSYWCDCPARYAGQADCGKRKLPFNNS